MVGEASPDYLFYPQAPCRMAGVVPHARLIVLLRNPVDRAYSHYWHQVRRGFETLSFEEALEREPERCSSRGGEEDGGNIDFATHHFSYLARGVYADQLARWFRHFPREQFLILKSEDLFAEPATVYSRVLEFLRLPPWQPAAFSDLNRMASGGMSQTVRRRLEDHFATHNERLERLLGQHFVYGWTR